MTAPIEHDSTGHIVTKKGTHWTQLPENKEKLHKIRKKGARTLAKKRADLSNLTPAQKRTRRNAQKRKSAKLRRASRSSSTDKEKLTDGNIQAKELTVSALGFAYVKGYLTAFAEANGLSYLQVANWVGTALLRSS